MNHSSSGSFTDEAVGVFQDGERLEAAVDELQISGFTRASLSMLAGEDTVRKKLGHRYSSVAEIEDDPAVPREAFIDTDSRTEGSAALVGGLFYLGAVAAAGGVVATGGTLAGAILPALAAGGGGGLIGAALSRSLNRDHAERLQKQIDRGGLILWVRCIDEEHQEKAKRILQSHGAEDVHVHRMHRTGDMVDVGAAMSDPSSVFDDPLQVPEERTLTRDQKIGILRQWEYDLREEAVATEENMPGGGDTAGTIDRVHKALRDLGAERREPGPAGKQGGA